MAKKTDHLAKKERQHNEQAVARCEELIDLARRGQAPAVESQAREWRRMALQAGESRDAGLACHALATSLLVQSRNAEALALFVDVAQAARDAGDLDRHVRALVQSASALSDMGAQHRALELLTDASHLVDSRVSDRALYALHAVRANIAFSVHDFAQALTHAEAAQSLADREASPLSSLINRWHIGDMLFAQAIDAWRHGIVSAAEQLASATRQLQTTAIEATDISADRIAATCYAVIGFAAAWTGDLALAQQVLDGHRERANDHHSVDIRFRFACVRIALRIVETNIHVSEIDTLMAAYRDVGLIERFSGFRLLGDIARKSSQAPIAARAYDASLALQDEIAREFGVGLAEVTRLRDDLGALRATAQAAQTELITERRGRQNLEARVVLLQNEVTLDALTSLVNRRGLETVFDVWNRTPDSTPMALAFIDVDRFKEINDQHGHAAGDAALVTLGEAMRAVVRDGDCVGRYAGDEFVIIFCDSGMDAATAACQRLNTHLATFAPRSVGSGDRDRALTVSIGIAARRPGESMEHLLQRADKALYRAKAAGRARIAVDEAD